MKYVQLSSFQADFNRLEPLEQAIFIEAVRQIGAAFARRGAQPSPDRPAALRVKPVEGAPGIREMTWSSPVPNWRATFEIVDVAGEPAIRWRRIGDQRIFREP